MLKKIIIGILTLLVSNSYAQNQQLDINYKIKIERDKKSKTSELIKSIEEQKFKLILSDSESLFFGVEKVRNEISKTEELASIVTEYKNKFYTDDKNIIVEKEISGNTLLVEKNKNFVKWIVTKEKKMIGKYTCYKARGKILKTNFKDEESEIDVIAWYCPEINYSYGPIGYNGLPGLILELKIAKMTYFATKIVNRRVYSNIDKPTKGKKMTEEQFEEFSKKRFDNRKS